MALFSHGRIRKVIDFVFEKIYIKYKWYVYLCGGLYGTGFKKTTTLGANFAVRFWEGSSSNKYKVNIYHTVSRQKGRTLYERLGLK